MIMKKKFYIAVDCEGAACVTGSPGKGLKESPNAAFAFRQATREANAAALALFEQGAEEVIVWDNHGTGVNLDYDSLDTRCRIVSGAGHKGRFPKIDETFGGVLFIGYHSRENTFEATLAHTYSSTAFQYYKINGREVGELEIDAAFAGACGVPVLFVSSDDKTVAQVRESFPWAVTVQTKESLSWSSAISLHPLESCRRIQDGVREAMKKIEKMQSFSFSEPLEVEIRFKRMDDAHAAVLVDSKGTPFAFKDAFTRTGRIASLRALF